MNKTIIQRFSKTVDDFAKKIAIVDGDERVTFGDLNRLVNVYSAYIEANTNLNDVVAIYLPKSTKSIAAGLAVSYTSCAYMYLDVKSPGGRVEKIIKNINPTLIISAGKCYKDIVDFCGQIPVVNIDNFIDCDSAFDASDRMSKVIDTDIYCIINTSGSTGVPKSVALNHRSFLDFCEWTDTEFNKQNFESLGSLSPAIFDIFSFELCLLITYGSTIVIVPDSYAAFPIKIVQHLERHSPTFIFWVPTIMVNIANLKLLANASLDSLKLIWFAGEVFPTQQFNYWRKLLPGASFVNMYGPIEITLDCTYYKIVRDIKDEEPIPIGFPCNNTSVLILNEENKACALGEQGELCVRGSSLALGYYNNPEATQKAFVQNPLNHLYPEIIYRTGDIVMLNELGEIVYKGRKDNLVKHMGYRIELNEIEHVAIANGIVKNCCVVYSHEKKCITMHYERKCDIANMTNIARTLAGLLPKYMVPTHYIEYEELLMNPNGKIDRNYYKDISK